MKRFVFVLLMIQLSAPVWAQRERLEVVYSSIGGSGIPLWIAQEKGFFERNGLDTRLIYIGGGRIVAQSFAAGQVRIAIMAGPAMVSANLAGLNLRMVAGLVNTSTYSLFVKPSINSPQELKGKRFGMGSFGSSPDFMMRQIFRRLGLDPEKDVTILQLGGGGDLVRLAALKAGSVDGALLSPPLTALARDAGFRELITPQNLVIPYQQTGVATTKEYIEKNRDSVRRFVKAMVEALHYYKSRKEESLAVVAKNLKTNDRVALEESYREFAVKLHPRKPYPTVEGIALILDSQRTKNTPASVRAEDYLDMSFVKELDDSGFIDKLYGGR
ncbi:MAG TPA: ABC transporter substrate-binding protein [Candidatus Binatus sp.]|nr:ABC transporter substrate-binding protein [Candidatus Binatus sp.]